MRTEELSAFAPPEEPKPREGAVLVLFGDGPRGPDLLLTERAHDMRSQPGQVSFPGGSLDAGETHEQAALREAHEETGIDPAQVRVFAVLPRIYLPPRNFAVAPVLAYWDEPGEVRNVNPAEVHAIYRVPIEELLDPAFRFSTMHPLGWTGPGWGVGPSHDVVLWGFTAGIINAIFDHVGWTREWDRDVVRRLPEHMIDWPRIAKFLGVDVPFDEEFDPVEAGLVKPEYYDLDRDHKPGTPA
jgi:8-oxo-dGTP pyrophosphatase MutT (NUDIX family)